MSTRLKISCQISQLPTLAGYIINSFTRDQADFLAYSPIYNKTFLSNLQLQADNLQSLLNPKQITAELKTITARIYKNQIALRHPLNLIEGYINRASNLTMSARDFGISTVRTANNKSNIPMLIHSLNYLIANIKKNYVPLNAKGLKPALLDNLESLYNQIIEDNTAQNLKISERKALVQNNYATMNLFWASLVDICDLGKRLYKTSAPYKLQEYSIRKCISKLQSNKHKTQPITITTTHALQLPKTIICIQSTKAANEKHIKLTPTTTSILKSTSKVNCTTTGFLPLPIHQIKHTMLVGICNPVR